MTRSCLLFAVNVMPYFLFVPRQLQMYGIEFPANVKPYTSGIYLAKPRKHTYTNLLMFLISCPLAEAIT